MNNLFKYFTTDKAPVHFPGAFFLLAAVFMLLSIHYMERIKQRKEIGYHQTTT